MAKKSKAKNKVRGARGTVVTITGHHFRPGATVIFGNQEVSANWQNAQTLVATAPDVGTPCSVHVFVKNPNNAVAQSPTDFEYYEPDPDITDIDPNRGEVSSRKKGKDQANGAKKNGGKANGGKKA